MNVYLPHTSYRYLMEEDWSLSVNIYMQAGNRQCNSLSVTYNYHAHFNMQKTLPVIFLYWASLSLHSQKQEAPDTAIFNCNSAGLACSLLLI